MLAVVIVVALLLSTAFVAYAAWEDTRSTQVTANILPLPEDTFQIIYAYCSETVIGYNANCYIGIVNNSPTPILVGDIVMEVSTDYPAVTTLVSLNHLTHNISPGEEWQLIFEYYTDDPMGEPGEVTFDVTVTCSGD